MELITSPRNPRIKAAARLRVRRQRERQGRFLIDGAREIGRALDRRFPIEEIYWCAELADGLATELANQAEQLGVVVVQVTPLVASRLAYGERDDGLIAVATTPARHIDDLSLPPAGLVAVLEGVEKPGNIGAILRSADAAGVNAVIIADGGTDLFNPNTIRASLGVIFSMPIAVATSSATRRWLTSCGLAIFAARVDAERLYTEADYRGPTAFILGSEATGLSPEWRTADVQPIRLPMHGAADSLNVSTTAAILFYEAVRQRGVGGPPS